MHHDSEIIALLQKRDEAALEMIRSVYGKLCRQLAFQITGSREDAEECVSDTLMEVWRSIPPNEPKSLRAYLAALTRRNAINRYQHERRLKRGGSQFAAALDEIAEIVPAAETVETELERRELLDQTAVLLRTLPDREKAIFLQRYYLAASVQSIAAQFGITQNAVKLSLRRTRKKLKEAFEKEGLL